MKELLSLKEIRCEYEHRPVVRGLSMHVNRGSLVCLLGPSGCGKTTALRAIAGFHPLSGGEIKINGAPVSAPGYTLPPEKRRLGMVFQDYSLFPHLNVTDNVAFGLRHLSADKRHAVAASMLAVVGLEDMGERYPHELSGGQQQRVALARALAPQPDLILMDEPFSNLDVDLRERLSEDVRLILKKQGITGILVTHDQNEAFALGDQVGVMNDGALLQWDTPYNLYHEPNCRFVADFIGQGVFMDGVLVTPDTVETEIGRLQGNRAYDCPAGTGVEILLRPDDVIPDHQSPLKAEIIHKAFKGAEILYTLRLQSGGRLLSLFPSHADHSLGETVGIRVEADHLVLFPKNTDIQTCAPESVAVAHS